MIQIYIMCLAFIVGGMVMSIAGGLYSLGIALKQRWIIRSICSALVVVSCVTVQTYFLVWTLRHGSVLR